MRYGEMESFSVVDYARALQDGAVTPLRGPTIHLPMLRQRGAPFLALQGDQSPALLTPLTMACGV